MTDPRQTPYALTQELTDILKEQTSIEREQASLLAAELAFQTESPVWRRRIVQWSSTSGFWFVLGSVIRAGAGPRAAGTAAVIVACLCWFVVLGLLVNRLTVSSRLVKRFEDLAPRITTYNERVDRYLDDVEAARSQVTHVTDK